MEEVARKAKVASYQLASASNNVRNRMLLSIRDELVKNRVYIEAANDSDCNIASQSGSVSPSLLKRLNFKGEKFDDAINGINDLIEMNDPVGRMTLHTEIAKGLNLYRMTCPIGVLAVIFEARPEAAIQIASLAIKSGNALILKGGKEAAKTNREIYNAIRKGLEEFAAVSPDVIFLVDTRHEISELLCLNQYIDLVIPRGSNSLVKHIKANTSIPVLGHADGICSIYIDKDCCMEMGVGIVVDSKTDYPSACNACETLLVHKEIAPSFLPLLHQSLLVATGGQMVIKADERAKELLPKEGVELAEEDDFKTEHLALRLSIKVVPSLSSAVEHINSHGSHHTDVIVSSNAEAAEVFMQEVDSAGVYHNCSSRFADGYRYGFGAEVGISTNKIHARGPVGLEGLVIYKYRLVGEGQTVADVKKGEVKYTHRKIL